jgi:MFS family permease
MIHVVPLHHKPKLFAAVSNSQRYFPSPPFSLVSGDIFHFKIIPFNIRQLLTPRKMGGMQVVAQIGGPLIGGAFTTNVTWRWCFYINLPIGGLAMTSIALFLDIPQQRDLADKPLKWKLRQLDIPGTILVASGAICILLALQWGGQTYAVSYLPRLTFPVSLIDHLQWNNGRIIALLTVGCLCLIGFVAVQILFPETATLPRRLFKSRSVIAAFFLFVFFSCSNFVFSKSIHVLHWSRQILRDSSKTIVYFIPNWFQAITHVSAAQSGIRTIPLMAASIVGLMVGGIATTKIGYYTPCAILGACLASVGAGLISTWTVDTSEAKWIGYQIINGIGLGFVYQVPNLAIQTVLPKRDAPTGFAMALFGGLLLSSVFVSVGENVLANQLVSRLSKLTGSPIDASTVYASGATTLLNQLPEDQRHAGLIAYNASLQVVFQIGLALSCICVPGACALEWKSVAAPWAKKKEVDESTAEKGTEDSDRSSAEKKDGGADKTMTGGF